MGRRWEIAAVEGLLQRAIEGHGAVVTVVGSPSIGKSRMVPRGLSASRSGASRCSLPTANPTPRSALHAVARLPDRPQALSTLTLRRARTQLRGLDSEVDPDDLLLFEDLLGIADPAVRLPKIDPDARRRRLTAWSTPHRWRGIPGGLRHRGCPLD